MVFLLLKSARNRVITSDARLPSRIRPEELDKAVEAIGPGVTAVQGDVSNLDDLDRLFSKVWSGQGRIDVLLANAGVGALEPLGKITEEAFDLVFGVNVKGAVFTVQKGLPLMREGGSIILTGSTTASMGTRAFSVYSARKTAIRNLTRSWALDLKGHGRRCGPSGPRRLANGGMQSQQRNRASCFGLC